MTVLPFHEFRITRQGPKSSHDGLRGLLHIGGVSMSGLTQLLSRIRNQGDPGSVSRFRLHTLNLERFSHMHNSFKIPMKGGGEFVWETVDFTKALPALLECSAALAQVYADAFRRSPPSRDRPWSAVMSYDEFCPGNKLQASKRLT